MTSYGFPLAIWTCVLSTSADPEVEVFCPILLEEDLLFHADLAKRTLKDLITEAFNKIQLTVHAVYKLNAFTNLTILRVTKRYS